MKNPQFKWEQSGFHQHLDWLVDERAPYGKHVWVYLGGDLSGNHFPALFRKVFSADSLGEQGMPQKIWACYCPHSKFTPKLGQAKAQIWAGDKPLSGRSPWPTGTAGREEPRLEKGLQNTGRYQSPAFPYVPRGNCARAQGSHME